MKSNGRGLASAVGAALLLVVIGLVSWPRPDGPVRPLSSSRHCDYFGRSTEVGADQSLFPPDKGTMAIIARIMGVTGLDANFRVYTLPGSANAFAMIDANSRLILFDPIFFADVEHDTRTAWSRYAILAHEVGHHLLGHTLEDSGSRPDQELGADRYSGFVLQRMGATDEEAAAALALVADPAGSATHPPKHERLEAISAGWEQAHQLERRPALTARYVFHGDPRTFLVTSAGDVVTENAPGSYVLVGHQTPSTEPGYKWLIQVPAGAYKIDVNGLIWGQGPGGHPVQFGYVTTP